MWRSVECARNPAQACHIAVLTLIVMVVGCSRSKSPLAPPKSNVAAAKTREVLQREVSEAQTKVDQLGAQVTKTELDLASLRAKAKPADEKSTAAPDKATQDALAKEIEATEERLIDQRSALTQATNDLTAHNIDLQKVQQDTNALKNDSDKK